MNSHWSVNHNDRNRITPLQYPASENVIETHNLYYNILITEIYNTIEIQNHVTDNCAKQIDTMVKRCRPIIVDLNDAKLDYVNRLLVPNYYIHI